MTQMPRSSHRSLLLGFRHQTAPPAAYVALGLLRQFLDCLEVILLEHEDLCEVELISFADFKLSASRAAHRFHNALCLQPAVVAIEMK